MDDWEAKRDEWVAAIDRLSTDVESWAKEQQWLVQRGRKTVAEDRIGCYEVPVLTIQTSAGPLILDPIARYIVGSSGRIDLCAFPSFERVLIVRTDEGWQFVTNPPTSGRPWSKEVFPDIALELAASCPTRVLR